MFPHVESYGEAATTAGFPKRFCSCGGCVVPAPSSRPPHPPEPGRSGAPGGVPRIRSPTDTRYFRSMTLGRSHPAARSSSSHSAAKSTSLSGKPQLPERRICGGGRKLNGADLFLASLMATTLAGLLREGASQGARYACYGFLAPTSSTDTPYLPRSYPPQAVSSQRNRFARRAARWGGVDFSVCAVRLLQKRPNSRWR
jgi:hypothetical protein